MEQMNYAIRYGAGADFPTSLAGRYRWQVVPPEVFAGKTQGILYLSSNVSGKICQPDSCIIVSTDRSGSSTVHFFHNAVQHLLNYQCNTVSNRDSLAYVLSYHLDIDSIGKCINSKMFPRRLRHLEFDHQGKNKRKWWSNYFEATGALLKTYRFRLLILSTLCENYFAEKVRQTLEAGTIPIYLGIPNSHDWDPGIAAGVHPAMIHIQDYDSIKELAKYVTQLSADTEDARKARLKFFEYQHAPTFEFPRHRVSLMKRAGVGASTREDFICTTVHKGDSARKIEPQPPCEGTWFEFLKKKGRDLKNWDVDLAKKYKTDEQFYETYGRRLAFGRVFGTHENMLVVLVVLTGLVCLSLMHALQRLIGKDILGISWCCRRTTINKSPVGRRSGPVHWAHYVNIMHHLLPTTSA